MAKNERLPALLLKMKALHSRLSRAEQRVVDYIIANPEKVIYLSVAGLAEQSGVSDATVVRTCRHLGLDGYQDLKVTLAQDIVTPLQSIHEEVDEGDDAATVVSKVFQATLHTLNFTHDTLKAADVEAAAEALLGARVVAVLGLGNSHAVACDFQHKLMRLGLNAAAYTDSHLQAIAMVHLGPGDVAFCVSHSGSSRDIVDSARLARDNGATVVSLTNIGSSPLSKVSDIRLHTASKETQYRIVAISSRIAQMAIIDAIYTIIALKIPGKTRDGFNRVYKALLGKKY